MPIERAKMRIRINLPANNAKHIKEKLIHCISCVEDEQWQQGSLEMVKDSATLSILNPTVFLADAFVCLDWSY